MSASSIAFNLANNSRTLQRQAQSELSKLQEEYDLVVCVHDRLGARNEQLIAFVGDERDRLTKISGLEKNMRTARQYRDTMSAKLNFPGYTSVSVAIATCIGELAMIMGVLSARIIELQARIGALTTQIVMLEASYYTLLFSEETARQSAPLVQEVLRGMHFGATTPTIRF